MVGWVGHKCCYNALTIKQKYAPKGDSFSYPFRENISHGASSNYTCSSLKNKNSKGVMALKPHRHYHIFSDLLPYEGCVLLNRMIMII